MNALRVVGVSARMQLSELRSSWAVIAVVAIQPVAFLLVALLPMTDPSVNEVSRVMLGVLLSVSWSATAWGAASVLRRERAMGTLARALTGHVDARLIVLGKGLGASVATTLAAMIVLVIVAFLMGLGVDVVQPGPTLVAFVVLFASGSTIGLMIGSIFVLSRYGAQISALLVYPVLLLGGMLIPIAVVPAPLQVLSNLISLRWIQQFMVTVIEGNPGWISLGWATLLTVAYGLVGWWLFGKVVRKSRHDGTVSLY